MSYPNIGIHNNNRLKSALTAVNSAVLSGLNFKSIDFYITA